MQRTPRHIMGMNGRYKGRWLHERSDRNSYPANAARYSGPLQCYCGGGCLSFIAAIYQPAKVLSYPRTPGLEAGLIFLVVSVLVPFASGRVAPRDMLQSFVSLPGLIAIASGIIATHMNCQGLELLQRFPQMMIGMVIGSIIGVAFFGGIPVGPLMAGGIAALLVHLMAWLR